MTIRMAVTEMSPMKINFTIRLSCCRKRIMGERRPYIRRGKDTGHGFEVPGTETSRRHNSLNYKWICVSRPLHPSQLRNQYGYPPTGSPGTGGGGGAAG